MNSPINTLMLTATIITIIIIMITTTITNMATVMSRRATLQSAV